jgi:hypothetical protein
MKTVEQVQDMSREEMFPEVDPIDLDHLEEQPQVLWALFWVNQEIDSLNNLEDSLTNRVLRDGMLRIREHLRNELRGIGEQRLGLQKQSCFEALAVQGENFEWLHR